MLRRDSDGRIKWFGVPGRPLNLEVQIDLFSYREDQLVFAVDRITGLAIAVQPTIPKLRQFVSGQLKIVGVDPLRHELQSAFKVLAPCPKPPLPPNLR